MELIRALRLDQAKGPPRVAFVGAGGKTTAIFQCARQSRGTVLVTATTHLAVDQLDLADRHFFVDDATLAGLERDLPHGLNLLTGPLDDATNRTQGVSGDLLDRIYALAERHQIPLLIEADGSRQKPLKAPADHEPFIPRFVDAVIVVAGLGAVGKWLTPEWVHRPEIFASLSGMKLGEMITPSALARVITHPKGGLRNIPPQARCVAILNQADTPDLQAQAAAVSSDILPEYDSVIISSFAQKSSNANFKSQIYTVHQPIAAVILAAGEARRFGSPKQLLNWGGKALIWHAAQKALQASLNPVLIVCGAEQDAIQHALADLPVELVHNPVWPQGQGSSVGLGTRTVCARSGGILFMLADQPQIPVSLIQTLRDAHAQSMNPITGPIIDGQRGNPILFDRDTFDDLAVLSGEVGGRKLFAKYAVDWIPWHDSSPLLDIDTPEDYARLLEMDAG